MWACLNCRGLVCLHEDWETVSTWKYYKSTVVQETSAISSLLRHKCITVPLTQTTTTWEPVQRWNFPTDKQHVKLEKVFGQVWGCTELYLWSPQWMRNLLAAPKQLGSKEAVFFFFFFSKFYHFFSNFISIVYLFLFMRFGLHHNLLLSFILLDYLSQLVELTNAFLIPDVTKRTN